MHIRYLKVGFKVKLSATIILQLITDHSTTARSKTTMQKYFLGPSPLPAWTKFKKGWQIKVLSDLKSFFDLRPSKRFCFCIATFYWLTISDLKKRVLFLFYFAWSPKFYFMRFWRLVFDKPKNTDIVKNLEWFLRKVKSDMFQHRMLGSVNVKYFWNDIFILKSRSRC